jgi:hypothetical protein
MLGNAQRERICHATCTLVGHVVGHNADAAERARDAAKWQGGTVGQVRRAMKRD